MTKDLSTKLAAFPRIGLTRVPTPLEPLKRLTAFLGGPRLWVKREDLTGLSFGGNKLRKLDYLLSAALQDGADTLVSGGVVQSNSQRQVAAGLVRLRRQPWDLTHCGNLFAGEVTLRISISFPI